MRRLFITLLSVLVVFSLTLSAFAQLPIYFGNLHAHTSYSDGVGDPWIAFEHARDLGKVHIQAVTDHCHYLRYPLADGSMRFPKTLLAAEEMNEEGRFLAIAGFEWTLTGQGHITVYDTQSYTHRDESDLYQLYDWLYAQGGIGSFAHPGAKYGDFFDFEYFPRADQVMHLIELGNGSTYVSRCINEEYYDRYQRALSRGWHLGAAANQDNHQADWGSGNSLRTGIMMKTLTLEDLYKALRARHTFATEDSNVKIVFRTLDAMMGDILYDKAIVTFTVEYSDPGDSIKSAQAIYSGGVRELPVQGDVWEATFTLSIDKPYEWVFIRVEQNDTNEVITSPIWIQDSKKIYLFNTFSYPARIVRDQPFKYGYEIANLNEAERTVLFEIKTPEKETLFQKTLVLESLGLFKEVIELSAPTKALTLYLDGEPYGEAGLEEVLFIAGIDTSHENYFLKELEPLSNFLVSLGGETVPIKGSINAAKLDNCNWLIVPLPPSDAMMPTFAVLTKRDVDLLKQYVYRGGHFIFVLPKEGSLPSTIGSFEQFFAEIGLPTRFSENGTRIEAKEKAKTIETGSHFLFLTWSEATNSDRLAEVLKGLSHLW